MRELRPREDLSTRLERLDAVSDPIEAARACLAALAHVEAFTSALFCARDVTTGAFVVMCASGPAAEPALFCRDDAEAEPSFTAGCVKRPFVHAYWDARPRVARHRFMPRVGEVLVAPVMSPEGRCVATFEILGRGLTHFGESLALAIELAAARYAARLDAMGVVGGFAIEERDGACVVRPRQESMVTARPRVPRPSAAAPARIPPPALAPSPVGQVCPADPDDAPPTVRDPEPTFDPVSLEPSESAFQVEVIEDMPRQSPPVRYRDAVRLADGSAFAVMTDVPGDAPLSAELVARWKSAVRAAAARGLGPDEVLHFLNAEMFEAKLGATACCAWLEPRDRILTVACAGTPSPWVIRKSRRIARPRPMASVALGTVRGAQWSACTLHFGQGDTLILPSAGWTGVLDQTLEGNLPPLSRLPEWLRGHPARPCRASVVCLTTA